MARADITITIDSNTRDIEYVVLEGIDLDPRHYFRFQRGEWVAKFPNFPIESDQDIDILIIVRGQQPGLNSKMTVSINDRQPIENYLFKPFNKNGYAQFNEAIRV